MKMSKLASKYYLHNIDRNHDTGASVCYFCASGQYGSPEDGWGIWIDRNGNVDVDDVSANGTLPSERLLKVLRIAARKQLS